MSFLLQTEIRRIWLRFLGSLAPTYLKYDCARSPCEIATQHHPMAGEFRGVTAPWRLGSQKLRPAPATPAPLRGEHGRSILHEIGLDDEAVDALVADGVVWTP